MDKKFELSPMMRQYLEMKEKYSDAILLYRLGDFYEMFFDDAITVSEALDLTLTGRDCGLEQRAPMCGVPYHAVDTYVSKLLETGFRVAICEQLSDPKASKGMVDRDVVRVITPGTVMEENILDEKKNNYICSVFLDESAFGLAWADLSTGEFCVTEYAEDDRFVKLEDLLVSIDPSEIICNEGFAMRCTEMLSFKVERLPEPVVFRAESFAESGAESTLLKQFKTASLDVFDCKEKPYAVQSAGGLIRYLLETQKRSLSHINKLKYVETASFMILDPNTRRNLELTESLRDRKKNQSLLGILDKTRTSMGARCIRNWLDRPLQNAEEINARLSAVEEFWDNAPLRVDLYEALSGIRDLERFAAKISYGSVNPRDCICIADTLRSVPAVKDAIKKVRAKLLKDIDSRIGNFDSVREFLEKAIDPESSALTKDGHFIREGFSEELDSYRNAKKLGKTWLAELEVKEREETGIKNLKVAYNKVFGYYIEVTNSMLDKVPYRYQRKQTLVGAERYITPELKEIEEKLLGAEESALRLELQMYDDIKTSLLDYVADFQNCSRAIGILDAILSLARVAAANKYCKPKITQKSRTLSIIEGRHPVVEAFKSVHDFVPNDTELSAENRTMVITGPNMAGKSTYMRQVALITLMAHIGSFVPAKSAEIPLCDRIFTRIGASDDVAGGQSTFMVEMLEVATILKNATSRSLLVLDEIGRGTSTLDGLSIAWAVLEYISKNLTGKTLFSTHFHELTELEGILSGVRNYRILVKEHSSGILFLHKIVRGGTNRSFGIEVAELAGVPQEVTDRAKVILQQLESTYKMRDTNSLMLKTVNKENSRQIGLFDENEHECVTILKETDLDNVTPMQALAILMDLKARALKDD